MAEFEPPISYVTRCQISKLHLVLQQMFGCRVHYYLTFPSQIAPTDRSCRDAEDQLQQVLKHFKEHMRWPNPKRVWKPSTTGACVMCGCGLVGNNKGHEWSQPTTSGDGDINHHAWKWRRSDVKWLQVTMVIMSKLIGPLGAGTWVRTRFHWMESRQWL